MIVKIDNELVKYTSFKQEVNIEGSTVNEVILNLFETFPQLYAFLICKDGEEADKTTIKLNDRYLVDRYCLWGKVGNTDVMVFSKDVPEGAGGIGKIIAGVVIIAAAIALAAPTGGQSLWAGMGAFGQMSAMFGASLILGGVGDLLVGRPNLPTDGNSSSSTYTFSGIHNTTVSGTPIPIIYGRHRIGGHILNAYVSAEGATSFLYAQLGLSEGEVEEVEKNSIKINDRYATNFEDVTAYYRAGDAYNLVGTNGTLMYSKSSSTEYPLADLPKLTTLEDPRNYVLEYTMAGLEHASSVKLDMSIVQYPSMQDYSVVASPPKIHMVGDSGELLVMYGTVVADVSAYSSAFYITYKVSTIFDFIVPDYSGSVKIILEPDVYSMQEITLRKYTAYNKDLETVDSNDVMYGFNQVENSVGYNLHIPTEVVDEPDAIPPIEADPGIGAIISTQQEASLVKITIAAPVLYSQSGRAGASVKFKVFYRKTSDASREWVLFVPDNPVTDWNLIRSKDATKTETVKSVSVVLPTVDYYDIKVVRDITSKENPADVTKSDTIYIKDVNEITFGDLVYPCTALLGLRIKATDSISGGMPTVTSIVKGVKVEVPTGYVSYYDEARCYSVRHFSGTWDGTTTIMWTDNPVWCLYDLLTNERYGLGKDFKILETRRNIMLANFFAMAQYADTYIKDDGTETTYDDPEGRPRFSLNLVIDQQKSAREWVNVICACMRATLYNCEGIVFLDIDRPKPITQLFNVSNISEYVQSGVSFKATPNVYQVQYANRDKDFDQDSFTYDTPRIQASTNPNPVVQNLDMLGVTNQKDARNLVLYTASKIESSQTTVSFKTGTDLLMSTVLDVIGVQHDVPAWGSGGKLVSVVSNTLELSTPYSYSPTNLNNGSLYGSLSIAISQAGQAPVTLAIQEPSIAGTYDTVTVVPQTGFTPAEGDTYILNFTTNTVKPFKIVYMQRDTDDFVTVNAVEYNGSIYSDDITRTGNIVSSNYSSLPTISKDSVIGFSVEKYVSPEQAKTFKADLDIWYTVPSNSLWKGLQVAYGKIDATTYTYVPTDNTGHVRVSIPIEEEGDYIFIGISQWKDGTSQSIDECLADQSNSPFDTIHLNRTIPADVFSAASVANLKASGSSTGAFTGKDCDVTWTAIPSDGTVDTTQLLDYYVVTVKNVDGTFRRAARSTDEHFAYTHQMNISDLPKVTRSFDVTVYAVDIFGRASLPATIRCSNQTPSALI